MNAHRRLRESELAGKFRHRRCVVLEAREVDPVSLVRFNNVLLTKAAVGQFEEMLG